MPCPPFHSAHRVSYSGLCLSGTDPFRMESFGCRFELIMNEMRRLDDAPTPNAWRPAECEGRIRIIICGGQRRGKSGWKKGLSGLSLEALFLLSFSVYLAWVGSGWRWWVDVMWVFSSKRPLRFCEIHVSVNSVLFL